MWALRIRRSFSHDASTTKADHNDLVVIQEALSPVTSAAGAPALTVDHLSKRFSDRTAVDDVSSAQLGCQ